MEVPKTCFFLREKGATMSYGAHTLPKNRADRAEQDGVDENTRFPKKNKVVEEILSDKFAKHLNILEPTFTNLP